jgi:hypothetical protein
MDKHIVKMRGNNVPKDQIKLVGNTISTRLPGDLFFLVTRRADLISRVEMGDVRFGKSS